MGTSPEMRRAGAAKPRGTAVQEHKGERRYEHPQGMLREWVPCNEPPCDERGNAIDRKTRRVAMEEIQRLRSTFGGGGTVDEEYMFEKWLRGVKNPVVEENLARAHGKLIDQVVKMRRETYLAVATSVNNTREQLWMTRLASVFKTAIVASGVLSGLALMTT